MRTSHEIFKRASAGFVRGWPPRRETKPSDCLLENFKVRGESKGWAFLLEVPGNLFLKPELRAAVFYRWNQPANLLYVLFDETGSQVVLYDDTEAPAVANQLAYSYSSILRKLCGYQPEHSLH